MSGGHFDYIQRKLEDISLDLKEIIDLEEGVNNGEVECMEEVDVYALKIVHKDGNSKMFRDARFRSYSDALNILTKEGYRIEEREGQRSFRAIKDDIKYDINEVIKCIYFKGNEEVYPYGYSSNTLEEFKKGIDAINKATVYINRIDWLLSGDDGEDTFHERLKEDLEEYEKSKIQ